MLYTYLFKYNTLLSSIFIHDEAAICVSNLIVQIKIKVLSFFYIKKKLFKILVNVSLPSVSLNSEYFGVIYCNSTAIMMKMILSTNLMIDN